MSRPPKYSDDQKDKAVQLAQELGSYREAAAITGIGISTIRGHAQAAAGHTQPARSYAHRRPKSREPVEIWVRDLAARVIDGLDLTALAGDAGHDPIRAGWHLDQLVTELRSTS